MAEIVLGVIPLIGAAISTYHTIYTNLKAFRHYDRDLRRVTKKLAVQRDSFKLECWILLRHALSEESVRSLKADSNSSYWSNPGIDAEFRRNFDTSYETTRDIVEDITNCLKELDTELEQFAPLLESRRTNESLGDVARRLKGKARIVVNRKKYEEMCRDLRDSNKDLTALREKLQELQAPPRVSRRFQSGERVGNGGWSMACKARRASAALYQGLQQVWSCQSSPHGRHSMRLFLNPPEPDQSRMIAMRMSIAVVGTTSNDGRIMQVACHLSVESQYTQFISDSPISSPRHQHHRDALMELPAPKRIRALPPPFRTGGQNSPPLQTQISHPAASLPSGSRRVVETVQRELTKGLDEDASLDLRCIMDLCQHFGQHCLCPAQSMPPYIGYLDVEGEEKLRHKFWRDQSRARMQTSVDDNMSLSRLLALPAMRTVNIPERLKLARAIAAAALTYYDTPWMKDFWRLGDISLLLSSQELEVILQTLHLEVDLQQQKQKYLAIPRDESAMDLVLTPESATSLSEDDLLRQGIYNKPLHSLGVALVGIETSQDFDPSDPEDVLSARKAARGSMFGPKYQDVVQRCFAYNSGLNKPRSHKAAYENIIGSLEEMITALDALDMDD